MAVATTEFYPYPETREEEEEEEEEEEGQEKTKDNEEQLVNLVEQKREERMKRLRELHLRKNEARKLNHQEVVEEDRRKKLPVNYESRRRKAEWEIQEEDAKKRAEEAGEDYEQIKMLETSADELDRLERKRKKKNPDPGFADYQQASYRQYQRLSKQIKPDMENYDKQKQEMGSDFYPSSDTLGYGGSGEVSQEGLERMVDDLEKQIDKHSKFSRRRAFKHNDDVDYINERNMRFNKKAARYYDKYTTETKQNLERGTAI